MSEAGQEVPTRAQSLRAVRRVAGVLTSAGSARWLVDPLSGDGGFELPARATALLAFDPFAGVTVDISPSHGDAGDASRASRRAPNVHRALGVETDDAGVTVRPSSRGRGPDSMSSSRLDVARTPNINPAGIPRRSDVDTRLTDMSPAQSVDSPLIAHGEGANRRDGVRSGDDASHAASSPTSVRSDVVSGRLSSPHFSDVEASGSAQLTKSGDAVPSSGMVLLAELASAVERRTGPVRAQGARKSGPAFPPFVAHGESPARASEIAGLDEPIVQSRQGLWRRPNASRLFPRDALRGNGVPSAHADGPGFDHASPESSVHHEPRSHAHQRDTRPAVDVVDVITSALRDEARRHGVDLS